MQIWKFTIKLRLVFNWRNEEQKAKIGALRLEISDQNYFKTEIKTPLSIARSDFSTSLH